MTKVYKIGVIILFLMTGIIPLYSDTGNYSSFKNACKNKLTESYKKSFFQKSTLYKDYVEAHLTTLSKKENECRYKRTILKANDSDCKDCELLTEERIRFVTAYAHKHEKKGTVITDNKTYQEIGVPHLIEQIPTALTMGKVTFTAEICSPTTESSEIHESQTKQQFLENNESTTDKIQNELKKALPGENALLNMYNSNICIKASTVLTPYSVQGPLKILPNALQNSASARNVYAASDILSPTFNLMIISLQKVNTGIEPIDSVMKPMGIMFEYSNAISRIPRGIKNGNILNLIFGVIHCSLCASRKVKDSSPTQKSILSAMPYITISTDYIYEAYELYQRRSSESETAIHQSLIDVADYVRSAEKIYTLMQSDSALKKQFPHFCPTYEAMLHDEKTKNLMNDLLNTNTFQGSPSPFSNAGRIAITSERLIQEKEHIMPLMQAMGELDAYIGLVQFKKTQGKSIPFIYTQPTKAKNAFINAKAFAHPAISESKPNNFELGGDEHALTAIVTGPNGCGKSFSAKAAALNIILSETFGAAQAEQFEHSFIDNIRFVANVSDEVGSKSRYQAEVESIGELFRKNIETAHENKNGLYIVDEPLSATNERGGSKGLEEYIERVDNIPNNNNLRVVITHHDIKDMNNVTHYQVQDGDGKFVIVPGRSRYSNAEKLVTEELTRREKEFQDHCAFL